MDEWVGRVRLMINKLDALKLNQETIKNEMNSKIDSAKNEMNSEIQSVKSEIQSVKNEMMVTIKNEIQSIKTEILEAVKNETDWVTNYSSQLRFLMQT